MISDLKIEFDSFSLRTGVLMRLVSKFFIGLPNVTDETAPNVGSVGVKAGLT